MRLSTEQLTRCLLTLDTAVQHLGRVPPDSIEYEIYRNAVVKGFELSLETAGKLLRKVLKSYTANPRTVDAMTFKDLLRQAAKHGLLHPAAVERWFGYRDNRNNTAHDYGVGFAEETLGLLPAFLQDARQLETVLREKFGHADS